ncbi:MAG TPA: helix-turn-helix domain-containing protein [Acidimicrobiales bacterium]|nr:helix-turn-helix domain-containing protein [Acidimicrobiales bacterium]
MARPAPGADRSVAVLDLMASHPDERFTLSEVARRCDLNKATAHALLSALADHGVLLRHPAEKRYSLGPRLVAIGDAARRGYTALDFLPPLLDRLVARTGFVARAWHRQDDQVVVVAQSPPRRADGDEVRLPLTPPVGALFLAWSDSPSVEAWLARAPAAEAVRPALDALPALRRLGFALTLASPEWRALTEPRPPGSTAGAPPDDEAPGEEVRRLLAAVARQRVLAADVDPAATYLPAEVAAPVFSAAGRAELTLAVTVPAGVDLTGRQVLAVGREVGATADELTAAVRGRRPAHT